MSQNTPPSCNETLDKLPEQLSLSRKSILLFMFCSAGFLDAFNNSTIYPAIPAIEASMGIPQSETAWIISACQLTFASFMLISGRISDVYNPKMVLVAGLLLLSFFFLCSGFMNNKIALLVLRALTGIASAMTIPSALRLLVHVFPDPLEQARVIGIFGGCGACADLFGTFVGAVLVQYASYHWVFWFAAMVNTPVALCCLFVIPQEVARSKDESHADTDGTKWKSLDLIGISILTAALILFVYAVTSGSVDGWATPGVLTPLIISAILIAGFFYWETLIPFERAAIPPRTWFYNNFSVLFGSALLPLFWWNALLVVFMTLWQDVFHWTMISAAIHMFPVGMAAFVTSFTGALSRVYSPKWIIITGLSIAAVTTVLLVMGGSRPEDYWLYVFPALTLGSAGMMLAYTHTNIAIFQAAPASMAGMVGAIFNGALQFGSAIGLATFNSIQTSVEATHGGAQEYNGRAAAFWFLLGIVLVEIFLVSYFYRRQPTPKIDEYSKNNTGAEFPLGCGASTGHV